VVPTAPAAMPVVIEPPDLLERQHDAARERAEQVAEQLGPLARTRAMVEVGDPAGQIEQAGRELDAALILVGTHQRSTLAAALAGSHVTGADDGNASGADRALTARVFQLDRSLIRS
jgi:nucleotide-binding universal stress UspA family protein